MEPNMEDLRRFEEARGKGKAESLERWKVQKESEVCYTGYSQASETVSTTGS